MKKLLSIILSLCLLLSITSGIDFSSYAGEYTLDKMVYTLRYNNYATAELYTGTSSSVSIPASFVLNSTLYKVDTIAAGVFRQKADITDINIPKTVTKIEDGVFDNCKSLSYINVDSGNTIYYSNKGVLFEANYLKNILVQARARRMLFLKQ